MKKFAALIFILISTIGYVNTVYPQFNSVNALQPDSTFLITGKYVGVARYENLNDYLFFGNEKIRLPGRFTGSEVYFDVPIIIDKSQFEPDKSSILNYPLYGFHERDYYIHNFTVRNSLFRGTAYLKNIKVYKRMFDESFDLDVLYYNKQTLQDVLCFNKNTVQDFLMFDRVICRIQVFDNKIESSTLKINNSRADLTFWGNTSKGQLKLFSKGNQDLRLRNYQPDLYDPQSRESEQHMAKVKMQKSFSLDSENDSLTAVDLINRGKSKNEYTFYNGHFISNGLYVFISNEESITNIWFEKVNFKNAIELKFKNIDTLDFSDCKAEAQIKLNIVPSNKLMWLNFKNTDVKLFDFDFYDNIKIYFDKDATDDYKHSVFSALLEKYKSQGKPNSYQNVDIQYRKFKHHQNFMVGSVIDICDDLWWNYGYSKDRIIYITLGALVLFFLVNFSISEELMVFYPIFTHEWRFHDSRLYRISNHAIIMFIMTIYIFFSLRLELDKIDARNNKMMIYFFVQYFFGLICLLFILGAILKF